ncbi:MAG: hypothetical protein EYC70_06140 [Planctomycetota bacterium]|nr:MAG: hypothetical protein EYC70_06140 [Planctomycetota bacterium]
MPLAVAVLLVASVQESQVASGKLPVAVLRSGKHVECGPEVKPGATAFVTPFGRYSDAVDPVAEVRDAGREAAMLREVRAADPAAWLARASERGLVSEIAQAASAALATPEPEDEAPLLAELECWGGAFDPVPAKVDMEKRVDWMWTELGKADAVRAALLTGRLLVEVRGSGGLAHQRVGLVDLRRGLRSGQPGLRRAAAAVAARQGERDMVLPLVEASLADASPACRSASAQAVAGVDLNQALGRWTVALWRGKGEAERVHAAEHLGSFGNAGTIPGLIYALAASDARPAGGYIYIGRQISIVGDVDVEVAQAAAIADPVVSVIQEGTMLEVRVISTTITRTVMHSLRRLSGANPGPKEEDWLRWYAEQQKAANS